MASTSKAPAKTSETATRRRTRYIQVDEIARDLALMDELEVLVQSLPDHRATSGLGPLSLDATTSAYNEREAHLL